MNKISVFWTVWKMFSKTRQSRMHAWSTQIKCLNIVCICLFILLHPHVTYSPVTRVQTSKSKGKPNCFEALCVNHSIFKTSFDHFESSAHFIILSVLIIISTLSHSHFRVHIWPWLMSMCTTVTWCLVLAALGGTLLADFELQESQGLLSTAMIKDKEQDEATGKLGPKTFIYFNKVVATIDLFEHCTVFFLLFFL